VDASPALSGAPLPESGNVPSLEAAEEVSSGVDRVAVMG
jgi:hypothetical protein